MAARTDRPARGRSQRSVLRAIAGNRSRTLRYSDRSRASGLLAHQDHGTLTRCFAVLQRPAHRLQDVALVPRRISDSEVAYFSPLDRLGYRSGARTGPSHRWEPSSPGSCSGFRPKGTSSERVRRRILRWTS
jgi:hypothetical protein